MKFSTIVWGGTNPISPESPASLLHTAQLYRDFKNIQHEWYILVLDGYNNYLHIKAPLKELNCHLVDLNASFNHKHQKYKNVYDLYVQNNYPAEVQFKNTVRFLVAHEYFAGEPFLNVDADLVVNDEPNLIVSEDKSLYMGSTCFVYIKDKDFVGMYDEIIKEMITDTDAYIDRIRNIAIQNHPGQNAWSVMDPKPYNMSILEEGLFYALLLTNNLDWKSTNQYVHIPFIYDLYKKLSNPTWKRVSPLKDLYNEYKFIETKHHINGQPLAYMHYQYNFRFILSFYILQNILGIPKESMYCPAVCGDMTPLRDDIKQIVGSYLSNIQKNQKNFRYAIYSHNFVSDILLCNLMGNAIFYGRKIFDVNPLEYKHMLEIEKNGGLCNVFNNYFWYGENVFI